MFSAYNYCVIDVEFENPKLAQRKAIVAGLPCTYCTTVELVTDQTPPPIQFKVVSDF